MKIAHLSTSSTGGAAITAKLISDIQNKYGHKSRIFSRPNDLAYTRAFKSRVFTALSFANAKSTYSQLTHWSVDTLSLDNLNEFQPEVVFIHNWFNLLSEETIVTIANSYPTIFVTHDSRLATGGCHVTLGCRNFKNGCSKCPAAIFQFLSTITKAKLDTSLREIERYGVISPSHWLMNELSNSELIRSAKVKGVIPNPSSAYASEFKFDTTKDREKTKILFIASSLNAHYKGYELLIDALRRLDGSSKLTSRIEVTIVGDKKDSRHQFLDSRIEVQMVGTKDQAEIHNLICNSDLLVVPSLSENFPGVIAEAQLLGCAVAASRVGGIPEMVEDGINGFLFEPNSHELADSILRAIQFPDLIRIKVNARAQALLRHDEVTINMQYNEVIRELLLQ